MRGLIVLCLCTVGIAAPQGYSYNQGGIGVQQSAHNNLIRNFGAVSNTAGGNFFANGQRIQQLNFGGQQLHQHQQQQAIVSKHFFIHSAPDDVEEEYKEQHITVGVPKKNYNIVFIKSPVRSHKKTAIKISPAPNEEKTVIYVLSKKTDASDIQAEIIEQATTTAKPEVYFIKYKTNEEANHAQEQIRAQYDALGGTSQVTDEGVAPVTSIVGSLAGADIGITGNAGSAMGATHAIGSASLSNSQASSNSFAAVQTGVIAVSSNSNSNNPNSNAYLPPNFH